jgi:hypothetical protein
MALKPVVDTIDEVPETIRDEYKQGEDGKFHLANFVPKDKVEDVSGLKSALQKERENSRKAAKERDELKSTLGDDFDPEQYKTLKQQAAERALLDAERKGEWDKLRGQMTEAHAKELDKRAKREQTLIQTLTVERIDKEAAMVCNELKGNATLLMPHIRGKTKLVEEDGTFLVRVLDEQGNPRVNAEGKFLSIRDLVSEMQGQDIYAGAFAGTGNSGGGTPPGEGGGKSGGNGGGKPPTGDLKRSSMAPAAKVAYINAHGQEAYMNLPW